MESAPERELGLRVPAPNPPHASTHLS
jgi:hypothetical protein